MRPIADGAPRERPYLGSIEKVSDKRRVLLAALAVAAAACACSAPAAQAAGHGASPFRHDLRRVDSRLRRAVEIAPVPLGEGLATSETVCDLAERAETRGDAAAAAADWSTLSQLVTELDQPAMRSVDAAILSADSALRQLRERYAPRWPQRERVNGLRLGVARARQGTKLLGAAMAKIAGSFAAWQGRQCGAAITATEAGVAMIPSALGRINDGMRRLWSLALR